MAIYDNRTLSGLEQLRSKNINRNQPAGERLDYNNVSTYQSESINNSNPVFDAEPTQREVPIGSQTYSQYDRVEKSNNYMESLGYVPQDVEPRIVTNPNVNNSSAVVDNTVPVIDNSVSVVEEKHLDVVSENKPDLFPSIRSIINKTSVTKVTPNVTLELLCDNYNIDIVADSTESAVAEFRRACSEQGIEGLEQMTKSMSLSYREKVSIHSDQLNKGVDSDYEITNFSTFEGEGVLVGSAIQTIFDRVGIGYLLD